jgi:hypothetical protein
MLVARCIESRQVSAKLTAAFLTLRLQGFTLIKLLDFLFIFATQIH